MSGETSWIEISSEAGPGALIGQRRARRRPPGRMGVGVVAFASLLASAARAERPPQRCPAMAGGSPTLAEIDPELRLRWIDARLAGTAHRARLWTWGWGTGLAVATLANLAPLAFVAPDDRIDWYVSAGTTLIGVVPLVIAPLDVVADSRALQASVAARSTDDDVCPLLAEAEAKLERDARNQADGRRWWLHLANVALNTGVGLFLALGYHHWLAGAFNAVSGTAIGEAIILTQPTSSIDDLRAYRAGSLGASYRWTF